MSATETGQRLLQYLKRASLLEADLLADLAERSDARWWWSRRSMPTAWVPGSSRPSPRC